MTITQTMTSQSLHSSLGEPQDNGDIKGKSQVSFYVNKHNIGVCDSIDVCYGSAHDDGCVVDGRIANAAT